MAMNFSERHELDNTTIKNTLWVPYSTYMEIGPKRERSALDFDQDGRLIGEPTYSGGTYKIHELRQLVSHEGHDRVYTISEEHPHPLSVVSVDEHTTVYRFTEIGFEQQHFPEIVEKLLREGYVTQAQVVLDISSRSDWWVQRNPDGLERLIGVAERHRISEGQLRLTMTLHDGKIVTKAYAHVEEQPYQATSSSEGREIEKDLGEVELVRTHTETSEGYVLRQVTDGRKAPGYYMQGQFGLLLLDNAQANQARLTTDYGNKHWQNERDALVEKTREQGRVLTHDSAEALVRDLRNAINTGPHIQEAIAILSKIGAGESLTPQEAKAAQDYLIERGAAQITAYTLYHLAEAVAAVPDPKADESFHYAPSYYDMRPSAFLQYDQPDRSWGSDLMLTDIYVQQKMITQEMANEAQRIAALISDQRGADFLVAEMREKAANMTYAVLMGEPYTSGRQREIRLDKRTALEVAGMPRKDPNRRRSYYPEAAGEARTWTLPTRYQNIWITEEQSNDKSYTGDFPHRLLIAPYPLPPYRWNPYTTL